MTVHANGRRSDSERLVPVRPATLPPHANRTQASAGQLQSRRWNTRPGAQPSTWHVAGTLLDEDSLPVVGRAVRVYRRSDGALIDAVVSDGSGAWTMPVPTPGEVYALAIDPATDATDVHPPIENRITPEVT